MDTFVYSSWACGVWTSFKHKQDVAYDVNHINVSGKQITEYNNKILFRYFYKMYIIMKKMQYHNCSG